jgi:hypothetical protein
MNPLSERFNLISVADCGHRPALRSRVGMSRLNRISETRTGLCVRR